MKKTLAYLIAILALSGCAHTLNHGTIAMKESDSLAHVSIHNVKEGQKLLLFRNKCSSRGGDKGDKNCERERLSEGTVKKVFNEHYSLVEFPSGVVFKEGDFVESM